MRDEPFVAVVVLNDNGLEDSIVVSRMTDRCVAVLLIAARGANQTQWLIVH
jgi:hypothetical protein